MTASTGSPQGLRRKDRLFAADAPRPTLEPPVLFRLPAFALPDAASAAATSAGGAADVVPPTANPEPEPIAVPATAALDQHFGNIATAPLPASGTPIAPRTQTDSRFLTTDTPQPEPVRESWAPLAPLGQAAKTSTTPFRGAVGGSQRKPWMEVAGSRLVLLLLLAVVAVAALIAARGTDISNPIRLAGQQTPDQPTSTGSPYASSGASSAASQRTDDAAGPNQLANTDQAPAAPGSGDSQAAAPRPAVRHYTTRRPGDAAADSQLGSQMKTDTAADDPQVLEFAPPATGGSLSASSERGASQRSPTDSERLADASAVSYDAAASSAGVSDSKEPDEAAMMLGPADRGTGVDNTAAQPTTPAATAAAGSPGAQSVNPYAELPMGDFNDALTMALQSADAPAAELPPAGAATPTSDDSVGPPPIQMTETPRGVYDWNRYLPPAGGSAAPAQDLAAQRSGDPYLAAAPGGFGYPTANPGDAAAVYPSAAASAPGPSGAGGFGSPAPQPPNGYAPYGGYGAPPPQTGYPDAGYLPTNNPNAGGYPNAGYPSAAGGYPNAGYPTGGYPTGGYPAGGYPAGGYPSAGYAPALGPQPSVPPQEAPLQASSPYDDFPRR